MVLIGLIIATFFIIHLVPGDPVLLVLGSHATPQSVARLRRLLHLNDPLPQQFWIYIRNLLEGHFGQSFTLDAPVGTLIGQRIGPSAALIFYSLFVAVVVGVPLAVLAAVRPNGLFDNVARLITTFTFAMPGFWLGLMLALLLGFKVAVFPVSGYETGFGGLVKTLTLPALTLGLPLSTVVVRTLRSALLEALRSDYVDAARSRGFSEVRIITRHAFRPAIMNTVTVLAVNVGFLIGGTVVVEQVFNIPGIGSLLYEAVEKRDYQLIQIIALMAGAAVVCANLVADLIQVAVDPRVRLSGE